MAEPAARCPGCCPGAVPVPAAHRGASERSDAPVAVMGCGGNGITFSVRAPKRITAAAFGRKVAEAPLFSFT